MQKRVGLARAIAAEPEIIFFDEPTTGLDPIMSGVINELIREIVVEMGATAMTITHDMSSVRAIADKVAMIHDGVVQWTGPIAQLETSGDPYLDQFLHGRAEGTDRGGAVAHADPARDCVRQDRHPAAGPCDDLRRQARRRQTLRTTGHPQGRDRYRCDGIARYGDTFLRAKFTLDRGRNDRADNVICFLDGDWYGAREPALLDALGLTAPPVIRCIADRPVEGASPDGFPVAEDG